MWIKNLALILFLFLKLISCQPDQAKLTALETEISSLRNELNRYKNYSDKEISNLRSENSFLKTVQSGNIRTLNKIMTDVFTIKSKLTFVNINSVTVNGSLDLVLELLKNVDNLNNSLAELVNGRPDKCQRGSQYVRKCVNAWNAANCALINIHVNFTSPFKEPPYVMFGVSKVDMDKDYNGRFQAFVKNITRTGFDYTIGTWGNSVLWGSTFEWLACPF